MVHARLASIQRSDRNKEIREPDHTRPDATDDNTRLDAPQATDPGAIHDDEALPASSRNNSGESGSDFRAWG
jgi:hypothetical protein